MQPFRKRLSALLCSLELATASPAVARLADNRFLTGPEGTPQIGQCRVANAPTFGTVLVGHAKAGPASVASALGLPCGLRLA